MPASLGLTDEERRLRKNAAQLLYHQKYPDRVRATRRKYAVTHREAERERKRRNSKTAKAQETKRLARARYAERNRERASRWAREHPKQHYAHSIKRIAKIRGAPKNDFTAEQWEELIVEYGGSCVYAAVSECRGPLTRDHVIPLCRGGSHTKSNIVPACKKHNSEKGTRLWADPRQSNPQGPDRET